METSTIAVLETTMLETNDKSSVTHYGAQEVACEASCLLCMAFTVALPAAFLSFSNCLQGLPVSQRVTYEQH